MLQSPLFHCHYEHVDKNTWQHLTRVKLNPQFWQGHDLTKRVGRLGNHYVAFGDYTDVWEADFDGVLGKVIIKLIRGTAGNKVWIEKLVKRLLNHGEVWSRLTHTNVAIFYGFTFELPHMPGLVLEYYPNGNINQYLAKNPTMSLQEKLRLLAEAADGILYLHEFDPSIVHGDIRGGNILINANHQAVICDYGLAFIIVGSEFTSVNMASTCRWTAPEVIDPPSLAEQLDKADFNDSEPAMFFAMESDVYAFGMTMIEVIGGKIPFSEKRLDSAVILSVIKGGRPELPPIVKTYTKLSELIEGCWNQTPGDRPPMADVCARLKSDILVPATAEQTLSAWWSPVFTYIMQWLPI